MSLTPLGNNKVMKGQQVRPAFRVDVSPLLKIVEAQSAEKVKTAQMFHPAGPDKTKPSSGNDPQQKPAPRPTIQQDKVNVGGDAPSPTGGEVSEVPSGGQPQQPDPVTQVKKPGQPQQGLPGAGDQQPGMEQQQPQQPQKSPQQEAQESADRVEMFTDLAQELENFIEQHGMSVGSTPTDDNLTLQIVVKPLVKAPDGQYYKGKDAYWSVFKKVRELVRKKGLIVMGGTQPVPVESHRQIDRENAKTVQFKMTISFPKGAGEAGAGGDNPDHHSNISFVPDGAKPVQPKTGDGQVRPNSRMGQPPEQKATDAEAMFGGGMGAAGMAPDQFGGMGADTLPNILASKKDEVIAALKKILGGK